MADLLGQCFDTVFYRNRLCRLPQQIQAPLITSDRSSDLHLRNPLNTIKKMVSVCFDSIESFIDYFDGYGADTLAKS